MVIKLETEEEDLDEDELEDELDEDEEDEDESDEDEDESDEDDEDSGESLGDQGMEECPDPWHRGHEGDLPSRCPTCGEKDKELDPV